MKLPPDVEVRRRDLWVTGLFVALVVAVVAVLGYIGVRTNLLNNGQLVGPSHLEESSADRFTTAALYVSPDALIAEAAAEDSRLISLAQVPQAVWFGGTDNATESAAALQTYLAGAAAAQAVPVVVLYNIPQRDCGGLARGGARTGASYLRWIDAMATALRTTTAAVMLEPDSIANSGECGGAQRLHLLAEATERLSAVGAQVYLDGGHSDWVGVPTMATRLIDAGVESGRGFFTNVANYRSTAAETRYGATLVSALAERGAGEVHFVIDTGRNGGTVKRGEWCNPDGARLGPEPMLSFRGALDGYLWIKPPAESDGTCQGGPSSGLWKAMALRLMGINDDE